MPSFAKKNRLFTMPSSNKKNERPVQMTLIFFLFSLFPNSTLSLFFLLSPSFSTCLIDNFHFQAKLFNFLKLRVKVGYFKGHCNLNS